MINVAEKDQQQEVDRFLNNFDELNSIKKYEDDKRLKELEEEIQLKREKYQNLRLNSPRKPNYSTYNTITNDKDSITRGIRTKKPVIPPKSDKSIKAFSGTDETDETEETDDLYSGNFNISLINPIPREEKTRLYNSIKNYQSPRKESRIKEERVKPDDDIDQLKASLIYPDLDYKIEKASSKAPKPIRYDDVMKPISRSDIRIDKTVKEKAVIKEKPIVKEKPIIKEKPIVKEKPKHVVEIEKKLTYKETHDYSNNSNKDKFENETKIYLPKPNYINVISSTAAAKAPPLMRPTTNDYDNSIDKRYNYLSRSPSPNKASPSSPSPSTSPSPHYQRQKQSPSKFESEYSVNVPKPRLENAIYAMAAAKAPPMLKASINGGSNNDKTFDLRKQGQILSSSYSTSHMSTSNNKSALSKPPAPKPKPSNIMSTYSKPDDDSTNGVTMNTIKLKHVTKPNEDSQSSDIGNALLSSSVKTPIPKPKPKPKDMNKIQATLEHNKKQNATKEELEINSIKLKNANRDTGSKISPLDRDNTEALKRLSNLRSTPSSPKKEEVIPEALSRFKSMKGAHERKERPPIATPSASVSIPTPIATNEASTPKDPRSALENLFRARTEPANFGSSIGGVSKSATTQFQVESRMPVQMGFALPGLADSSKFGFNTGSNSSGKLSRSKTVDNSDLIDKESQKLTHMTKNRAKGPRRKKLPSSVKHISEEIPITNTTTNNNKYGSIVSSNAVVKKKVPPPIRKSSRQVSTSELFI
ncbi:hypothetical protein B5S33_g2850 [[Candida] boidinii]|nr:hypothetical protein B5S30_g4518 [[Candida] boidinii]OWB84208.1 hypothetical protein B5S33_g2850 [[Candida] boidinii]